ncbi:SEC12-like protein 2 [Gossypium australe]|uniref:SEC12-like protein 2 n=1 Tax=Gossypium australe TaxID=47621 RepID=A0A5B6UM48_9ROSI|nr:SEC12-like protein 2 [Gossypium australe]
MHLCLLLMRFGFQAAPWMLEAKPISLCHVAKGWDDMDDHINGTTCYCCVFYEGERNYTLMQAC